MFKFMVFLIIFGTTLSISADGMRDFMLLHSKFTKLNSLKVSYKETTSYKIVDKTNSSEGSMFFMTPNLYRVESKELDVYANEFQVWNYDKKNKQTIIQKRQPGANPMELLIFNKQFMDLYELVSVESVKIGKQDTREYHFLRTEMGIEYPFTVIKVYISKKKNQPVMIKLEDSNQTVTSIEIKEFKENIKLERSFFEYRKIVGVEEIKMF